MAAKRHGEPKLDPAQPLSPKRVKNYSFAHVTAGGNTDYKFCEICYLAVIEKLLRGLAFNLSNSCSQVLYGIIHGKWQNF